MIQLRDAPQPCDSGHIHPVAPLPRWGTEHWSSLSMDVYQHDWGREVRMRISMCICGYVSVWMSFMGTEDDYFVRQQFLCLSQWEPLFIYLNFFPIVYILSVILWPFHIKSNNAKQTALINSKTHTPKMFIPFTSTTCWMNVIYHSIDRTEKNSNMPVT